MTDNTVLNNHIEADTGPYDEDDGYASSAASDTTSITSTIKQYIQENGRTYHRYKEGQYLSPNDEEERDRLDFYHAVQVKVLNGQLFLAPIKKNPQRILDCGTGTGIWALDMGEVYPSAVVIGVDLSPIQPEWVGPNVRFEIDDLGDEWTFPKDHFDFIHTRQLISGIRDLPRYVKQMYEHLAPGGYFEFSESGFTLHSDDGTSENSKVGYYFDFLNECAKKGGLVFPTEDDIAKYATEAGFVDVEIKRIKQPWGPWPKDKRLKEIGRMAGAVASCGLESYALAAFTRLGGKSPEEAKKICQDARNDILRNSGVHAYNYLWHVYGRKPEAA